MTVYYDPKEQVWAGLVMSGFSAMFGVAAFATAQDLPDPLAVLLTPIVGIVAFVLGLLATRSFVSGWHRRKDPVWLLRFTSKAVHINPVHPGYWHHLDSQEAIPMTLPIEAMDWIRRATKPRRTSEDVDEEFVEIRVNDERFQSAIEKRSDLRKRMLPGDLYESATIVSMFEGNVIRIFIEGGRWPEGIDDFWESQSYPTAPLFSIPDPVDLSAAKSQPRELF